MLFELNVTRVKIAKVGTHQEKINQSSIIAKCKISPIRKSKLS